MKSLSKFLSLIGVLGGLLITILWFPLLVKLLGLSAAVELSPTNSCGHSVGGDILLWIFPFSVYCFYSYQVYVYG